jgi:hypothetical protein
MRISRALDDECFVSRDVGILVQIFRIIDAINQSSAAKIFSCPLEEVLAMRRADRIDPQTVDAMSEARRDEPLLIAELGEHYWIIDGNHRLARRQRDGFEDVAVIEVPPELLVSCVEPLGF